MGSGLPDISPCRVISPCPHGAFVGKLMIMQVIIIMLSDFGQIPVKLINYNIFYLKCIWKTQS